MTFGGTAGALRGLLFGRRRPMSDPRRISTAIGGRILFNASLFVAAIAGLLFAGAGAALAESAGCSALSGNFNDANIPPITGTFEAADFNPGDTITVTLVNAGNGGTFDIFDNTTNTSLSGTLSSSGSYTFTAPTTDTIAVDVIQQSGGGFAISWSCTANPLTLTATPSTLKQVGQTYSQANQATFGTPPYTYSVVAGGTLPSNTTLNTTTGTVSGTPTAPGAFSYTIEVTDNGTPTPQTATAASSGTIVKDSTSVSVTSSLNPSDFGQSVTFTATVTGFSPTGTVSFFDGATQIGANQPLTGGVATLTTSTLTATAHTITAQYNGDTNNAQSPAGSLNSNPQVVNSDVTATQAIASKALTISIAVPSFIPVTGSNGTTPYSYSVGPGLPAGLNFSSLTGAISGTPTATSPATTYTVTVTDANGQIATASFSLTVNSAVTATQAIASKSLTLGQAATPPFTPVTGGGGTAPLTYSVSPLLLSGLNLNTATGTISGTPTLQSAATPYTVTVTDANGATAMAGFTLTVNSALTATLVIPSQTLTQSHAAASFAPVVGNNGTPPLSYSVLPLLPTGLNMNTSTGAITGTPTVTSPTTPYTVTVTDAAAATATQVFSLTVNGPGPTVTSVSPKSGPTAGGTSVTIMGSGFTGATAVAFGTNSATPFAVNSDSSITATSPAGSAGAVDVTVTTPAGTSATGVADGFTYFTAPTVTSISPNSGPAAGGTSVTITGTNFIGATAVNFASTPVAFTINSATSITAVSPAGTGTVDVTVTTPGGTSATVAGDKFSFAAGATTVPTVTALAPNAGPLGGGTSVTITGTNFTGATAVAFGTNSAASFTVNSATSITAVSPAGTGTVDVTVTAPGGTSATSAADHFIYTNGPSVSAVSPNAGPPAGGTVVTISGANFSGATAVNFGSLPAATFTVNNATQITATSPPQGAGSTVDVTVTTPNGTSPTSAADQFTYQQAPAVTAISPANGPTLGGTIVTISGTSFSGATAVKFGSTAAASFTVNSSTSITATAPTGIGTVDVTVTTPTGTSATSAADQYSYQPSHDFNGDGKSDVLWRDTGNNIGIWLMNGGSILQSKVLGAVPSNWAAVGQRDFNGDGKSDVLWRDSSGNVGVWFMNGTQIASAAMIGQVPTTWSVAATGDFNGDGKGDIVWRDTSGNVELWLMNGTSIISSVALGNVSTNWVIVGADMKGEIFWRNLATGEFGIWVMNGTTIAKSIDFGVVSLSWTFAGTGDFDGNGSTDMLWRDNQGNVAIWLMNGTSVTSSQVVGQMPLSVSIAETGDFSGNGKSDILWVDSSGNVSAWFMNGTSISSSPSYGNVGTTWTVQSLNAD